jgi:glycosyltransferase involved in cell wall biosynthesis
MGQSAPRVSILTPNLNHRPFLEKRLQSILEQTFSDWELIIVDNHSDDGAWEFFKNLPERDPRIRVFQAPRKGMYDNWNNCIRLAKGDCVYIATSDDTMAADFLERMVRALDENPECDLAHCKLRIIDESGGPCAALNWDRLFCALIFQDWIDRPHIRRAPFDGILHCGVRTVYTSITQLLVRKRLFDRVGLFSTRFGSAADFEWEMRASLLADTVHVPHYLATWRVHGRQGTDLKQLDAPSQKLKLIRMVRHAYHAARAIDPDRLRILRLSDLTYLYRKERLVAMIKEAQQRQAPKRPPLSRKAGIVLSWLFHDPLILFAFYRRRRDVRDFLNPLEPLEYPRSLLAKYGLAGNLVDSYQAADMETWSPEDRQTGEKLKKTHAWLFSHPAPIRLEQKCFPILIYQMGKVGSTSVDYTLKQKKLPNPVYHVHQLTPEGIAWTMRQTQESLERNDANRSLDSLTRVETRLYLSMVLREYRQNMLLQEEIRRVLKDIPWHIITMVRDPVSREISDFFFSLHLHPRLLALRGAPLQRECLQLLDAELQRKFNGDASYALSWFDNELGKVFPVDVYQFPFHAQRGYSILETGNIRILVFKMEMLTSCFSEAMERFLGIPGLKLINQNTAGQKNYHDLYRYAKERVSLAPQLCQRIYQSRYCQHFYSQAERAEWIRRWTASAEKGDGKAGDS